MELIVKSVARRYLSIHLRDSHGLTCLDRINLKLIYENMITLSSLLKKVTNRNKVKKKIIARTIKKIILEEYLKLLDIVIAEVPTRRTRNNPNPMNFERMEIHLLKIDVTVSERFRFTSMKFHESPK